MVRDPATKLTPRIQRCTDEVSMSSMERTAHIGVTAYGLGGQGVLSCLKEEVVSADGDKRVPGWEMSRRGQCCGGLRGQGSSRNFR